MQFKVLDKTFSFNSLKDIKLNQLIELNKIENTSTSAYIMAYVSVLTEIPTDIISRCNLDDLSKLVNHANEIISKAEHTKEPFIILNGNRLELPKWRVEAKAIFTDLTLQRYALMEQLTLSIKGVEEGQEGSIAALLACLYIAPDEEFTDNLFLQRKDDFLNADLNTIYNAFFLQTKRLNRFMRYINYYFKALGIVLKGEKKRNKLFKRFKATLTGQE